ncbi:lipopolysaccharide biosynthesis protein [Frigoribacterium sp. R86507]|uniref:lipopolysaccharide biosynthesis protein n=1 Tax=Frigoribacterium sp. R86507 TaxID=3093850 RepID=UPI0037C93AB4
MVLRRQFAWVAGGRIAASLLQALLLLLVARQAGPDQFAIFSAVFGIGVVVQNVFDLGLGTFVIRERAAARDNGRLTRALYISQRATLAMAVCSTLLLSFLAWQVDASFLVFVPLAIGMAAERNADVRLGIALSDGQAWAHTLNLVLRRAGALLIYIPLGFVAFLTPALAFGIAMGLTGICAAFASHAYIRKSVDLSGPLATTEATLRAAFPFFVNSLSSQLRNFDVAIVAAVGGVTAGGFYAAAARLTGPLRLLPQSLAVIMLPAASQPDATLATRKSALRTIGLSVTLMSLPYIAIAFATPFALVAVLGAEYEGAITAVQIVLGGMVFGSAASMLTSVLQGWGDQHAVGIISTVSTAVCLVLVGVGGLSFGATGAAIGLAVSFAVQAGLLALRLPRWFGVPEARPSTPSV